MYIHWGTEYEHHPNKNQADIADFCFNNGVNYIIGSHPHVIQKSEWLQDSLKDERFITWSLGNFISNQRKQYTDGGQMIKLVLEKQNNEVSIKESGYLLTWVYTPTVDYKKHFHILPCAKFELQPDFFTLEEDFNKMKIFIGDSRNLLNTHNIGVREYIYYENSWSNE
jgi:poly-gamma-glutamate synthesis protein (capsule biosynthesis protein)